MTLSLRGLLALTSVAVLHVGAGCSDPARVPPQGGVTFFISKAPSAEYRCPTTAALGSVRSGPSGVSAVRVEGLVTDGEGGNRVSCRVANAGAEGSGTRFAFTVSASGSNTSFFAEGSVVVPNGSPGGPGTLTSVSLFTPDALSLTSLENCSVEAKEVAAGRVWATFSCPLLGDVTTPSIGCRADPSSAFAFLDCDD